MDAGGKLRVGVVGGTTFGSSFPWRDHPRCTVTAVADLLEDRRDQLLEVYKGAAGYVTLGELLKDRNVDAVAVFTGAPGHARHAMEVLKAGKHVLCESPACWTIEEAGQLLEQVRKSGLTYMMAEPAWYLDYVISARRFFQEKRFGEVFSCDADYILPADELELVEGDLGSWRYGVPPMRYAARCLSLLTSISGERLTEVVCHGWADKTGPYQENTHKNPFSRETAFFKTSMGHAFRAKCWHKGGPAGPLAQWYGSMMSFLNNGRDLYRTGGQTEKDSGGFVRNLPTYERYNLPAWHKTDLLPEPLRRDTPFGNTLGFMVHEFVESALGGRRAGVDVYDALACTVPGIIAHESAMKDGALLKIPQFERPGERGPASPGREGAKP